MNVERPACPTCSSPMKIRNNRKTGEAFWGCVKFPFCKGNAQIREEVPEAVTEDSLVEMFQVITSGIKRRDAVIISLRTERDVAYGAARSLAQDLLVCLHEWESGDPKRRQDVMEALRNIFDNAIARTGNAAPLDDDYVAAVVAMLMSEQQSKTGDR